jgi:PAS domain S-box-containing protein
VAFALKNFTRAEAREQAERGLRASEERLKLVTENARVGLVMVNTERRYTFANTTYAEILGLASSVIVGERLADVLGSLYEEQVSPRLDRAFAGEVVSYELRREIAGVMRFFAVRYEPTTQDGRVVMVVVVLTDITERHRAEETIRNVNIDLELRVTERTAQLEVANKELEAFSYSISHDLRAPLRALEGYSLAVIEDSGPVLVGDSRRYLEMIRSETLRMAHLIDDLLEFSRLGRSPLRRQQVGMGQLVQSALDRLEPERAGREINLQVGALPVAQCDPALLQQVWINLLSNAFKYTRQRTPAEIEIGCNTKDGGTVYFVRDNGAGFDMRYASKLFGVFQRFHRADEFEGTGVGLAIVHQIVVRHGGRIWVEAAVGRGATFYFTLEEIAP